MKRIIISIAVLLFVSVSPQGFGQITTKKVILGVNDLWGLYYGHEEFYGLFITKKLGDDYYEYQVRKIDIKKYVPKSAINDYATVNYEKVKRDNLEYVLAGFDSLPNIVKGWKPKLNYISLYPGELKTFGSYQIYAKGERVGQGIANYRIGVKTTFAGKTVDQIIKKRDLLETTDFVDTDTIHYAGLRVDFVGDLDGDRNPEILLITAAQSECYSIILYSPDKNMKFKKVWEFQICS